jgi:hypothetical protein
VAVAPKEPEEEAEEAAAAASEEGVEDYFSSYSKHFKDTGKTKGRSRYFDSYFSDFDESIYGEDPLTMFRTASDFAQHEAKSLDEAVMKSRDMVRTIGTLNSGHGNVPIKPVGVPEKRATAVAQAMIERLSNVEDDEKRVQDEFKYDTKRLLKLQLNPMRGIRSAKVGKSKSPIAIFLDYSGSCTHVSNLFGLIMVGFANEGATILIGGNGVVNAVYHPFPNRPLQHYALDMSRIGTYAPVAETRVKAGILVKCAGSNLQDLTVGPLIACTDFDSYPALMARPRASTHVILALGSPHSENIRSVMSRGQVDIGADLTAWHAKLDAGMRSTHLVWYTNAQNLALHQMVYPVHDLDSLTTVLRTSR